MKKTFFPLLFIISFLMVFGCNSAKKLPKPEVNKFYGVQDSLLNGKYLKVKINKDKNLLLKFDTGAETSFIYDIASIGGEKMLTDGNHIAINAKGAVDSEFTAIKYAARNFSTNGFRSINQPIVVTNIPRSKISCLEGCLEGSGLLGMDIFSKTKPSLPLLLNYENNYIQFLEQKNFPQYKLINADFNDNRIFVKGYVNGKKIKFLFDTGSDNYAVVNEEEFLGKGTEKLEMETMVFTIKNMSSLKKIIYKNEKMKIENLGIEENVISFMPEVNVNLLGLLFIRNYNWIIDFENEKLYAQKIKDFDADEGIEEIKALTQAAAVINGKLMIIHSSVDNYKVGQIIKSVNGEEVTEENICRIFKFLMENRNWDKHNITLFNQ